MRKNLAVLFLLAIFVNVTPSFGLSIIYVGSDSAPKKNVAELDSEEILSLKMHVLALNLVKNEPDILLVDNEVLEKKHQKYLKEHLGFDWVWSDLGGSFEFSLVSRVGLVAGKKLTRHEVLTDKNETVFIDDLVNYEFSRRGNVFTLSFGLETKEKSFDGRVSGVPPEGNVFSISLDRQDSGTMLDTTFCESKSVNGINSASQATSSQKLLIGAALEKKFFQFPVELSFSSDYKVCGIYLNDDVEQKNSYRFSVDAEILGIDVAMQDSLGISILRDTSQDVHDVFKESGDLFQTIDTENEFVRFSTGKNRLFRKEVTLQLPLKKDTLSKLEKGLRLQVFLGVEQGGKSEIPYVVFDPSPTKVDIENKTVTVSVPPFAFSKNTLTEGEYQAIIILTYQKNIK